MKETLNFKKISARKIFALLLLPFAFSAVKAQQTPPAPSAPKSVKVPAVKEKKLANGLTVAVVERKGVPVVTVQLLVKSGASNEDLEQAGLANLTASLLTKGTKTKSATQIAEGMEFLGGSISSGAGWNSSFVTANVMTSKLDQAMAIFSDVVLNPSFKQEELDLLKSQTLDGLTYNLKQPGFLGSYVASVYSYNEHPAGGTQASINAITREDIAKFHKDNYEPDNAVLVFTGDITAVRANALAQKIFGKWKSVQKEIMTIIQSKEMPVDLPQVKTIPTKPAILKRVLIVDLPNSGQASVAYNIQTSSGGRVLWNDKTKKSEYNENYFPATVMNSVLGGGYSSRLNQEIRIKRGLSYGAGSSFAWRWIDTNFGTRTQTKNESAAEVAELVLEEIKKLGTESVGKNELVPRKSVLTGGFGRNLETTEGLANAVADLYVFELPTSELNTYMKNVEAVTDSQIKQFADQYLRGGDIIIVGDYAKFKDDLAKRFPNQKIEVVKADGLDLSKLN